MDAKAFLCQVRRLDYEIENKLIERALRNLQRILDEEEKRDG